MLYKELCVLYEKLESNSKRLEKTAYIADFLRKISREDMEKIILGHLFALDTFQCGLNFFFRAQVVSLFLENSASFGKESLEPFREPSFSLDGFFQRGQNR